MNNNDETYRLQRNEILIHVPDNRDWPLIYLLLLELDEKLSNLFFKFVLYNIQILVHENLNAQL